MGLFKVNSKTYNTEEDTINNASKKENNITNTKSIDIIKRFNVYDTNIKVEIKGVRVGLSDNKEIILDEVMLDERIKQLLTTLAKTTTKYNPIPKNIVLYNDDLKDNEKEEEIIENKEQDLLTVYEPKWSLEDVYMEKTDKEAVITTLTIAKYKETLFKEWGINGNKENGRAVCLNFWGSPGTGKSMAAEAIAKYLKKKLLVVNYSELESKYVGETPKNIKEVFKTARDKDAVIVFDEADSFLGKRLTNVTQSADYGVNITRSVMLIELENFDGVVIFTTNLLTNYDEAFKRRILANIEFRLPDINGRKAIWKAHLPKTMPINDDVTIEKLAKDFERVSGADIKDIIIFAATKCLREERRVVELTDFQYSYDVVMSRYKNDNLEIKTERITEEQYIRETEKTDKSN